MRARTLLVVRGLLVAFVESRDRKDVVDAQRREADGGVVQTGEVDWQSLAGLRAQVLACGYRRTHTRDG